MDLIDNATAIVTAAKADYLSALKSIDSLLAASVALDATSLTDAEAVQTAYTTGITPATLAALEQP